MRDTARTMSWIALLLLAATSLAVFWPATRHDFLLNWDDPQYVLENPAVHGLTIRNAVTAFTTWHLGNYAPLHLVSYMLDYEIWGLRPFGFILVNILLHTANGVLFLLLLRRLAEGKAWVPFAALLFLLHPVQVESVVWVSQRKNVLAMFFFLLAFHSYVSYRDAGRRHPGWYYALSLWAFLLALLAKSAAIIFPLAILLFDRCFRDGRNAGKRWADKIPFLAAGAVFGYLAVQSHSAQHLGGGTGYHGGTPFATFLTMLTVLIRYIALVLWPANLSAYYDVPVKTAVDPEVAVAAVLVVLLVVAGGILYLRRRDLFFWYAFFFIALLPVSQVVPIVTLMNDRYLYFPMLGASALLGFAFLRDAEWGGVERSKPQAAAGLLLLLAVGAFTATTMRRIGVWKDSHALWADAVRKAPNVSVTHDAYGEGLLARGEIDEAILQFHLALSREPDFSGGEIGVGLRAAYANTHNNLGTAYAMKGMYDDAIEQFGIAIRLNPLLADGYFNLGNALMQKDAAKAALVYFESAVRLKPGNPLFEANLRGARQSVKARDAEKPEGRVE